MTYLKNKYIMVLIILILGMIAYMIFYKPGVSIRSYGKINRTPKITPDYSDLIIPYNIASLNFCINEPAGRFYAKIYSECGDTIRIISKKPDIVIPLKKWKKLLENNKGKNLFFEILIKEDNAGWHLFKRIKNYISSDKIDHYLVYRLIDPAFNVWNVMGIYQRNIENFSQTPVLVNKITYDNCMNCHSFCNNNPDYMLLHLRAGPAAGTMIKRKNDMIKVNTKTAFSKAGAYPSWHPNGRLIAFSVNDLILAYHTKNEPREVLDLDSDLIIYDIDKNVITSIPGISDSEYLETFPAWSADGDYLYFCRTDKIDAFYTSPDDKLGIDYDKIQYDLMRISYNQKNGRWGRVEKVIAASDIGLSITLPRISPDNHFLLFCGAKYGNFPIYNKTADLYLLNLTSGQYKLLEANSREVDSYHSWSSNSRWFVFSSKRDDGLQAIPYFSYLDEKGNSYKPFVLPQENPKFYQTFLKTYNVPELITGQIKTRPQEYASAALQSALQAKLDAHLAPKKQKQENLPRWHE